MSSLVPTAGCNYLLFPTFPLCDFFVRTWHNLLSRRQHRARCDGTLYNRNRRLLAPADLFPLASTPPAFRSPHRFHPAGVPGPDAGPDEDGSSLELNAIRGRDWVNADAPLSWPGAVPVPPRGLACGTTLSPEAPSSRPRSIPSPRPRAARASSFSFLDRPLGAPVVGGA